MPASKTNPPGRMEPAVIDSSFWVHAHRSGLLPYVRRRFVLHFTAEVAAELDRRYPSGRAFHRLRQSGRLAEVLPQRREITEFGSGERSALNVALEHRDWTLLLDDRRPFEEAARRHLRVLCSPVLTVVLYADGALRAATAERILSALQAPGTLSPTLVQAAATLFHAVRTTRRSSRMGPPQPSADSGAADHRRWQRDREGG
jgi:predicted nucleic acid-binding protein